MAQKTIPPLGQSVATRKDHDGRTHGANEKDIGNGESAVIAAGADMPMQATSDAQVLRLQQANAQLVDASLEAQALAEQNRITGELRYRTLFESIDDGFCIIEKIGDDASGPLDFRFIEANPAVAQQSGISDVVGKTIREVIPDECEAWLPIWDQVHNTGEAIKFVRELVSQRRVLELYAFPIDDAAHRRVGVSFKDISERRQADTLLRRNHDTFVRMIENAPFGVYVVNEKFQICHVSKMSRPAFKNISPLIGRDFGEVMHILWHEEFANEAISRFRHTLDTGEPYVALNMTEQRHNIDQIESYDWMIERITLPDGQFGVVCYFYDITERKRAEDALRESEAFNRSIIESSPDCIKVLDLAGNLLSMHSGQDLLGIEDIGPFLNKSWIDFWEAEHHAVAQAAVGAAAQGRGRFVGFFRTLRGEPKWWDVSISPILDANKQPERLLAVSRDVTERKNYEEALRESEQRYRTLFNSMDEGFCLIEVIFDEQQKPVDWRFLEVNPAFEKQTGITDIIGKRMREIAPNHEEYWFETYGNVVKTGQPIRFINEAKELESRWFDLYAFRIDGEDSHKLAVVFTDITQHKAAEKALRDSVQELRKTEAELRLTQDALSSEKAALAEHVLQLQQTNEHLVRATIEAHTLAKEIEEGRTRMAHLAQHDALTDLPNRILLNDRLAQAISLAHRHGKQFALMFLDLDRFKLINDTLGHSIGDQLLQSVAKRLAATVRNTDTVCRLGGDEFVVLLADIEHAQDAAFSAENILAALTGTHRIDQFELQITVSIGISIYPEDGQNMDALLKNADAAMYQAKAFGRNNYQFFRPI